MPRFVKRYRAVPYTDAGPYDTDKLRNLAKSELVKALRREQEAQRNCLTFAVIYGEESDAPTHPVGVAVKGGVGWTVRFVR